VRTFWILGGFRVTWKNVSLIFRGGTQEARSLQRKKIRAISLLQRIPTVEITRPDGPRGPMIDIAAGTVGFVGYMPDNALDQIRLCFPKNGAPVTSFDAMMRGQINVVQVNWMTFRERFQIDI
jgi:hypothetical protein